MTPRAACEWERPAALTLFFQHQGEAERVYRAGRALDMIARGELAPQGLLVLPGATAPEGVIVCQGIPGGAGLIWPPALAAHRRSPEREDALIEAACSLLREQGARLVQCLLADDEARLGAPLLRNGFTHVTGLSYLRHDLTVTASWLRGADDTHFASYDPAQPDAFHATLEATYEQSLDCPEVNGVRSIAEVIQGHQAQGRFDPASWWLAWHEGVPAGVLMLQEQEPSVLEVVYMGVTPSARRRGIGREMLRHALCHARLQNAERLALSVDDRNQPAWKLYRGLGFEKYDHRQVLLKVWRG